MKRLKCYDRTTFCLAIHDRPSGFGRDVRKWTIDRRVNTAMILLVDDDPFVARALRIVFEMAGHRLDVATAPEDAYSHLARRHYDAILLDLNFTAGRTGGDEGLACLKRMLSADPSACVVVITAHSGIRIAVAAMQAGARDFVMKPWRNTELVAKVEAAMAQSAQRATMSAPTTAMGVATLLGDSPAMVDVRDLIGRMGPTAAAVAITGPGGSGRSCAARALHAASVAAARPPVTIDLRDLKAWEGLDDATGTLVLRFPDCLDEIAQSRLLARLPTDVRPIAIADNVRSLSPALRSRIATVEIAMPPLRERGHDALVLARHFVRVAAERHGIPMAKFTPAAEALLVGTNWPDEVRGLALAVERAVLLASSGDIDAAALAPTPITASRPVTTLPGFVLSDTERVIIAAALREHHHNVTQAAAALGLSRGALYRRMERYGL